MPDENTPTPDPKGGEEKTFTQAELDRIVETRLAKEKAKYSDYDDLKAKADKYDEHEAANKSETDKLREQVETLTKAQTDAESKALRAEIAMAKGLSAAQAKRMVGATREELEADADEILEAFPAQHGSTPPPSDTPKPDLSGGSDPTDGADDVDIRKVVESIPRGL